MEAYSYLNSLLLRPNSTYSQFETNLKTLAISQQTYLNLFLVTVVSHRGTSPDFHKYVHLLTNFRDYTGKKSADINYIGYKDHKNVFMHACQRANPHAIQILLQYKMQIEVTDPQGKTAAFYAIRNQSEQHSNSILTLLLNHSPALINIATNNGATILNQTVQTLRLSTIELLLKRGANLNHKLKDTGNTPSHELLKFYQTNRQAVHTILVLFAKYKANFEEPNNQGITVRESAKREGIHFEDYASFCALLEKDESVAEENGYQSDKMSLTTLNQPTKMGDTTSEICESDSNLYSGPADFSEADEQSIQRQTQYPFELSSDEEDPQPSLQQINFQFLSQEIIQFSSISQQKYKDMIPLAQKFIDSIDKIAKKHGLAVDIVGSFATGLWTQGSDIDISLVPRSNEYINFQATLEKIYKTIKLKKQQLSIEDIYYTKNKINTIKITLDSNYEHQMFDIGIFHRNHHNQLYTTYISQSLSTFPEIKPLFFTYKYMCTTFGLHDPFNGGLKTYALFLMIYSILKSMPTKNIGELFYHIALYYGFYFEFGYDDVPPEQSNEPINLLQYPVMKFNLMDPFNHKNNLGGKNTKAKHMQNMFRSIYYWLSQPVETPYLPQLFQLNQLF